MKEQITIIGAGPIGMAFALAAARLPRCHVTLIEREPPPEWANPLAALDHRVYALSPGSQRFLAQQDVWQHIPALRITPVRAMQVQGDDAQSRIQFQQGGPLAYIVEHAALMAALHRAAQEAIENGTLTLRAGLCLDALSAADDLNRRSLTFSDGSSLSTDLIIGADGSGSRVRGLAGIDTRVNDYQSDGVVANFGCEKPHGGIARQWFGQGSVLAYLPLPNNHISIVWSVSHERAQQLATLDPAALAKEVAAAGQHSLGNLVQASPVARFPLKRIIAASWVQPGLALIGDAAHAMHPLAGQGANLGFADAARLAQVLQGRSALSRIGDQPLLRRYERSRREAAWIMGETTERLRNLYSSDWAAAKWLRNRGLTALNRLPLAKALLMDYAMQ